MNVGDQSIEALDFTDAQTGWIAGGSTVYDTVRVWELAGRLRCADD